MGVEGNVNPLFSLIVKVEDKLKKLGFSKENDYFPHPLVRIKYPQKKTPSIDEFLNSSYDPIDFFIDRMQFFSSELLPSVLFIHFYNHFHLEKKLRELNMAVETNKGFELVITQIDRQFGKGSIMRLGGEHTPTTENSVSTGCLSLDVALELVVFQREE